MFKNKKTLAIFAIISLTCNISFAEVTAIQQLVLDDYMAMKDMTSLQRKDYRINLNKDKSRAEMKAYTQAFKEVRAVLPDYLGVTGNNTTNTSNNNPKNLNRTAGTNITYDTGTGIGSAGIASQMVGNRFDSALNTAGTMCCFPVETSGSITMITFDMAATFFSSAVWSLYSNVMGTTAMQVTSMGRGVMTGLNTLPVMTPTSANAYMNGAFLAGIFQFMPASTALQVDSMSTGGQGFHAISLNDGTTGTMLTSIMSRNAIFRVSGNVSTPVELINFKIE